MLIADNYFNACKEDSATVYYDKAFSAAKNPLKQETIVRKEALMKEPEWCMESQFYKSTLDRGNRAYTGKKYQEAKEAFTEAHQIKPEDPYPQQRLADCERAIVEQELARINAEYCSAIRQADSLFRLSNFLSAKQFYRKASNLKPIEQYPKDRIKVIDGMVICVDKHFPEAIRVADSLFLQKQFVESKRKYQEAAAIKTSELYPKEQIRKCDDSIAANRVNPEYDFYIRNADSLFAAKEFRQARTWYGEAAALKPEEQYAKSQIAKCDEFINDD